MGLLLIALPTLAKTHIVDIKKFKFSPQQLTINVGDTIIWNNIEKRQYHNVWFKALFEQEPDYFFPGESYQLSFNTIGTFNYSCAPHPRMTGVVTVIE